ncbi:GNAT family N-acetyltransferase [Hungatella sp.]|uniref:GNAT family N-acetyltransferase n=1 Tax=Hungatella sp. TaxID=2613924 RepID=UPI0032E39B43
MDNTPVIETERLRLRRFTERDAEALFTILSDPEVNQFLPMFPLTSLEEAGQYLKEHYLSTYEQPSGYQYAVCLKTDDIPIGYINVSDDDSHDLGYGLKKEFWKMGFMTEACRALIRKLKTTDLPYITATHDRKNPGSGRVMEKIGMIYQYSYEEQWQPKDILVIFRMYQLNFDGDQDRVYKKYWNKYPVHFIEKLEDGRMPETLTVNEKGYQVIRLLGKGKGGYSYLVTDGARSFVLKQIHHEPCDYYQFGDKLESELRDYKRLLDIGIPIPELYDVDLENERILKEYIEGNTIYDLVLCDQVKPSYFRQIKDMCGRLYPANTNIDYFPTNFVVQNDTLYYIDYECNDYMEEWNFENWGSRYWSRTKEFLEYEQSQISRRRQQGI